MSLTTKYGTSVNVYFDGESDFPATVDNTLHLFPLNGFSSSDFSKTVNIVNASTVPNQTIKNPVTFERLQFGKYTATITDAGKCTLMIDESTGPWDANYGVKIIVDKSLGVRNVGIRAQNTDDTVHGVAGGWLIDSQGGQLIKGPLTILSTTPSRNFFQIGEASLKGELSLSGTSTKAFPVLQNLTLTPSTSPIGTQMVAANISYAQFNNIGLISPLSSVNYITIMPANGTTNLITLTINQSNFFYNPINNRALLWTGICEFSDDTYTLYTASVGSATTIICELKQTSSLLHRMKIPSFTTILQ